MFKLIIFSILSIVYSNILQCNKTIVFNNFYNSISSNYSKTLLLQYNQTNQIPEFKCNIVDFDCQSSKIFINHIIHFDDLLHKIHMKYYYFYNDLTLIESMNQCLIWNDINSEIELFEYSYDDFLIFIINCIDVKHYFKSYVDIKYKYSQLIKFYLFDIPPTDRFLFSYCEP